LHVERGKENASAPDITAYHSKWTSFPDVVFFVSRFISVLLSCYSPLAFLHGSILLARADTVCAVYRYKELLAKKKATSAVQVVQEEQTVTSSPSGA